MSNQGFSPARIANPPSYRQCCLIGCSCMPAGSLQVTLQYSFMLAFDSELHHSGHLQKHYGLAIPYSEVQATTITLITDIMSSAQSNLHCACARHRGCYGNLQARAYPALKLCDIMLTSRKFHMWYSKRITELQAYKERSNFRSSQTCLQLKRSSKSSKTLHATAHCHLLQAL